MTAADVFWALVIAACVAAITRWALSGRRLPVLPAWLSAAYSGWQRGRQHHGRHCAADVAEHLAAMTPDPDRPVDYWPAYYPPGPMLPAPSPASGQEPIAGDTLPAGDPVTLPGPTPPHGAGQPPLGQLVQAVPHPLQAGQPVRGEHPYPALDYERHDAVIHVSEDGISIRPKGDWKETRPIPVTSPVIGGAWLRLVDVGDKGDQRFVAWDPAEWIAEHQMAGVA